MLIYLDMSYKIKVYIKKEIIFFNIKNEVDGDEDMLILDNKVESVIIKTELEMIEIEKEQICSQYWCIECQTGFESENDFIDYISFVYDEFVMKLDVCSGFDNSNDDGTLKYEDFFNDVEEDDDDFSSDNEDENFKVLKKVNNKGLNKDFDNVYSLLLFYLNYLVEILNSRMNLEDEEVGSECFNQLEYNSMGNFKSVFFSFLDITSFVFNMLVFSMNE